MPARRQSVGGSFAGQSGSPIPTISKTSCDAGLVPAAYSGFANVHAVRLLQSGPRIDVILAGRNDEKRHSMRERQIVQL